VYFEWRDLLPAVREIRISRCVVTKDEPKAMQLHVFCDASEKAFGAVVYVRMVDVTGNTSTRFLTAKSKVAPVQSVSIARLELCAALLGTRLLASVLESIDRLGLDPELFAWTDSANVLHWLNKHTYHWMTFIANRIAEIQKLLPRPLWHHVPTEDNPADCVSRGVTVTELKEHKLYWYGPWFLGLDPCFPPDPRNNQKGLWKRRSSQRYM
jgi:hypothetical protein